MFDILFPWTYIKNWPYAEIIGTRLEEFLDEKIACAILKHKRDEDWAELEKSLYCTDSDKYKIESLARELGYRFETGGRWTKIKK